MNPLESWMEEQRSAYLYRACADAEAGTVRAELFRRLAGEAEAQAAILPRDLFFLTHARGSSRGSWACWDRGASATCSPR